MARSRTRGIAAGTLAAFLVVQMPAPAQELRKDHLVPVDKKLDPAWVKALYEKGAPRVYRGEELVPIGMPVGGIGAGHVYLGGDGRLRHWAVFNKHVNTGYGHRCYRKWQPEARIEQGFALRVVTGRRAVIRRLDANGVKDVRFVGEYPIAAVEYRDPALGVDVTMKAFSPFIPLNAADSGLPATVLRFTLRNTGRRKVEATLAGWLENAVLFHNRQSTQVQAISTVSRRDGMTWVGLAAKPAPAPAVVRKAVVFADFEGTDYGEWKVEGKAFGKGPVRGTLPFQQTVSGFRGKGLVNTYLGKDGPHGKLTSPAFTIERPFINFLVGGGNDAGKTCINLVVGGEVVRTATGRRVERLIPHVWSVRPFAGKKAHIEIVDRASGPWGHVNVDHIEFSDLPRSSTADIRDLPDFGTMGLAVLGPASGALSSGAIAAGPLPAKLFAPDGKLSRRGPSDTGSVCGAVGRVIALDPGGTASADFVVAWHFPNHKRGHFYATRFRSAEDVARHVADHFERLAGDTQLWHDTYYDSTLPHWLLDRLHMPVSTLATNTVQWWANGRFWAWEGVGCCAGTCTHVWNYEQAMGRLFPSLERSIRTMQDFGEGFDDASGLVGFRSNRAYAADGQCGTVLKTYREHLMSADDAFLRKVYPKVRKATLFLMQQDATDGAEDGWITNSQHNTFDINFHGPNTFVGSLYLAALRAMEEMAKVSKDGDFAARCRKAFEAGSRKTMQELFDGEYFIQEVDLTKHPKHQYGPGCLADQLFGQNWAHQLPLGYLYPKEAVGKGIRSVFKYNWAPDVGPQNKIHRPERVFALPGEAGLFICTWPKSRHLEGSGVRYRNEVWTGIEYQAAAGLIYEGCLDEALTIVRAVHDRYDARKRNPWNEVECGDHYARALASWGCLLGLAGFEYDGPAGRIGFAPRVTPDDFRCAFTAAEGWGTLEQKRTVASQTNTIAVRWGRLRLTAIDIALPPALKGAKIAVRAGGRAVNVAAQGFEAGKVRVQLARPVVLQRGDRLTVEGARP
jgi:non-lysosomal glucosylceramidase